MFSIPWKHAARHGWTMDQDASLFKMWAIHTGKYVAGQECNPKTWKANFRCALHSLPDVEEVKDQSIQKGQGAMRVYRMLPQRSEDEIKMEDIDPDYDPSHRDTDPSHRDTDPSQDRAVVSAAFSHDHAPLTFDFKMADESDVPDVSFMVEVGTHKFEVSPVHSPDSSYYDYNDITITISQPLDRDALKSGLSLNEPHTSPGSHWSDESSGEELYTSLAPSLSPPAELWSTTPPLTLLTL